MTGRKPEENETKKTKNKVQTRREGRFLRAERKLRVMKMKVRKIHHSSLSFLCKTCVQLCYTSSLTIFIVFILNAFYSQSVYVNAYMNDIDFSPQSQKLSGKVVVAKNLTAVNRNGRFLFDTLFDISPPAITVDDEFDDVDDDEEACKCGE